MIKESGIVERLNDSGLFGRASWSEVELLCREAATLIAELQAERVNLNKRLDAHKATIMDAGARILAAESSLHRVRGETIEECALIALSERQHSNQLNYRADAAGYAEMAYEQACDDVASAIRNIASQEAVAETDADAPGNAGLVSGVSSDQTSLNITGLDTGAVKTAESNHSPSTREG